MKKINLSLIIIPFIFFGCNSSSNSTDNDNNNTTKPEIEIQSIEIKANELTEAEKAAGWVLLFDGQSTDQWRAYGKENFPDDAWDIDEEGSLYNKGKGVDIISKKPFGNFELKVDFMMSDTGNSGIFYKVQELEGHSLWHMAPEYQLLDNNTFREMSKHKDITLHATADNYDMHASSGDYSNPAGKWNTAKIVVKDNHIEHWLNGKKTVEYEINSKDWKARFAKSKFSKYKEYAQAKKGYLGLQDHGHSTKFRNIKIKELE